MLQPVPALVGAGSQMPLVTTQGAGNPAQLQQLANQIQQSTGAIGQLRSGAQVRADTKASTDLMLKQFNDSIIPQITAAAQNAGASGDALTALLAQNAAANAAGQAGANIANAVASNEQSRAKAADAHMQQLNNLLSTLQQAHTAVLGQQAQLQGIYNTNLTSANNANTQANASMHNAQLSADAQLAAQYSVNATSRANNKNTNDTQWAIANLKSNPQGGGSGYISPFVKRK